MKKLLKICRKGNMKLSQDKLQLGREVVYGWKNIEGARQKGDKKTRVCILPSLEKLSTFLDIETPKYRSTEEIERLQCMYHPQKKS